MSAGGFTVKTVEDHVGDFKKAIQEAKKMQVLVGITQEKDSRKGEISNAELLFIHTNGSPLRGIPARPVIEPAIKDDKEVITKLLGEALKATLEGDISRTKTYLNAAGLEGENASKDWFTSPKNNWPPNAVSTMVAKRKKGSTDPKPLIDTGELRKSITYVIKEG